MPILSPVLVVGATGQQGSSVVRALQGLPQPPVIRAISRNPSSPAAQRLSEQGIEVVKGDLSDVGSLEKALAGVGSAFLVTTISAKGGPTEDQLGINMVTAAQRVSLPFLVFSSVSDATPTCGIPHFETKAKVEEALKTSGLRHAVVAPVAFADNFPKASGFGLTMVLGLFEAALRGKKLQLVAVDDIGYVAAEVLNNPDRYSGRHIKLAGDSLSVSEIRSIYSRVEKKGVWKTWMPSAVISLLPHDFRMMMRMFGKTGYTADIEASRKEFPKLHTFEQWVEQVHRA